MLVAFIVRLLVLAVKIVPSIFATVVLISSTIFFMFFSILYTSIIALIPFSVLWYNLIQSSLSFHNVSLVYVVQFS